MQPFRSKSTFCSHFFEILDYSARFEIPGKVLAPKFLNSTSFKLYKFKDCTYSRAPVCEVTFHPRDHNVIRVVGSEFLCQLTEGVLKPFGFAKEEHHELTCHEWVSPK